MALPKRRSSKAKVRTRRQHWMRALPSGARRTCGHCGAVMLPHRFCPKCKKYGDLTLGREKTPAPDTKGKK